MTREEYLYKVKSMLPINPFCAEVGVLKGEFSMLIFNILHPKALFLIDPFETRNEKIYDDGHLVAYSNQFDKEYVKHKFRNEVETVSIIETYSVIAAPTLADGSFDFIYIDASHLYQDVLDDLRAFYPKIKKGGCIAGHDYGLTFPGVIKAVNEFCKEYNLDIDIINHDGGDFAIWKR